MTVLFYVFNRQILAIFSDKTEVEEIWDAALLIRCIVFFPDFYQIILQGVIRSLGIQGQFVWINLITYWIINMPLAYLLSITAEVGFNGMWYSIFIAQFILAVVYTRALNKTNWQAISDESIKRNEEEEKK